MSYIGRWIRPSMLMPRWQGTCLVMWIVASSFMPALGQMDQEQQPLRERLAGMPGRPPEGTPGPWDSDVLVYRVSPSGQVAKLATFERAGVPTLARFKDGRLIAAHQYFPAEDEASFDKVAVRFSSDEGKTWTSPQVIRLTGLPEGMRFPFDPTLVPLPDGRVRLYFTSLRGRQFEASTPAIYSAISANSVDYTFEPGMRYGIEGQPVIDCAVVLHQGVFHLYSPDNGSRRGPGKRVVAEIIDSGPRSGVGYHAVSEDGLRFTRVDDVRINGYRQWLGNAQSDGHMITFFGTGQSGGPTPPGVGQPRGGVWPATSTDGQSWKLIESPPIPGADPGAVAARDGGWIVVVTGPPRPGTPSERRFRGGQPGEQSMPPSPSASGDPSADGPWNHRVLLATSKDGLTWEVAREVLAEQASVPELFAGPDGRPIILFVDASGRSERGALGAMIRQPDGSWMIRPTNLQGADPSVVRLKDRTYRAHTKDRDGGIQASSSADGLDWRSSGEAFRDERYPHVTDPDVFETPSGWVMLVSLGPRLLRCTSTDGLKFVAQGMMDLGGSVSDTVVVKGGWRTFFHVNASPQSGGKMIIRSAFTADGRSWRIEDGDRVRAPDEGPARLGVADPAPLELLDGSWLMALKSFIAGPRPPQMRENLRQRPGETEPGFDQPRPFMPRGSEPRQAGRIQVMIHDSQYAVAPAGKPGRFVTGQQADLMLGGIDFNNAGGPLLFNHPTGLASDGRRLLLTDRWNNRVLIWTRLSASNVPPDLVLGQMDFTTNNSGTSREKLNWPGNITITPDGSKVAVTDTNNDRVLIWNSFPSRNGVPADVVLELARLSEGGSPGPQQLRPRPEAEGRRFSDSPRPPGPGGPMQRLGWPWGVWTEGTKFAVVCTHGSAVLIWNSIPTHDNQPPDLMLRPSETGTPRNITSDGTFFALSDHNHGQQSRPATMVWLAFPASASQSPDFTWNEWMKGTFTPDHKLILAGMRSVSIWPQVPQSETVKPDIVLQPAGYRNGDGPDAVFAGGRLYVCNYNGNNVLVWNGLPTRSDQPPDFSLGSDAPEQDTLAENFFITNPVVATDGRSLFISSDFDRKLHVWRHLPNASGARPNVTYLLPDAPWDNALYSQTLVLAGKQTAYVWKRLPLQGEQPDVVLSGRIGSVQFREITGVALDEKHFYLADRQANRIYVWQGIPAADSEPAFTLDIESPGRLSSDGRYLAAAPFAGPTIHVWRIDELSSTAQATRLGGPGRFNLPGKCVIAKGHLFVADTSFNRVQVWHRAEDALAGSPPDVLLGAQNDQDRNPEIGRDKFFMPGTVAFDGSYLWVGEFKFSTRILRFSPKEQASLE